MGPTGSRPFLMIVSIVLVDEAGNEVSWAGEMVYSVDLTDPQEDYGLGLSAAKTRRAETRTLYVPAAGPAVLGDASAFAGQDILRVYGTLSDGNGASWDIPAPRDDIWESDGTTLDMTNADVITQVALMVSSWRGPGDVEVASISGGIRMEHVRGAGWIGGW